MAPSRRSQQRQTRLTFTPLPSSSPAAKGYHKQIQDRAAAVSLEPSPEMARRRRVGGNDGEQMDVATDSIPTPAASSLQRKHRNESFETSDSDSEPVRSIQRRSASHAKLNPRSRSTQQRLDFTSARDADSFSSPVRLSSPSRPQSSARAGIFGSQRPSRILDVSSDESDDLPSPGKLVLKSKDKKKSGVIRTTSAPTTRDTQPQAVDSESDGDNIVVSNDPANRIEQESEDEDDDMPTTAGMQRRKRARRSSYNSFISSSPPRAIDSDSDLEIIENPRKRTRRAETDEEDSEAETANQRKRSRKALQQEKDDLAEDVEFLGPSSDIEGSARKPRNTQTDKKSARQKALDRLKRKRSGLDSESEQPNEPPEELDEDSDEPDNVRQPPLKSSQMFKEDEYDQDFIEDDHDDTLGVPDDLPLEFTRFASSKPKELFKYAIEWMVQKKINPAFQMTDGLYDLAFRKLDDEVKGLAGSKFQSAAWTQDFTVALKSRPDIAYEHFDRNSGDNWLKDSCDACNRSNHPPTFQVQFQGKPYHRQTLEDVGGNDDDEDDASSEGENASETAGDKPDFDANEQLVPPENTIYYVGKFCMSNAQTAHALQHWRFHLNEWVVDWLGRQGYTADEQVVRRDKMSTKKRRKEANKITDRMEMDGVIKTLWKDFYHNIDEARTAKQGRGRLDSP